jgi:hypothetical protein
LQLFADVSKSLCGEANPQPCRMFSTRCRRERQVAGPMTESLAVEKQSPAAPHWAAMTKLPEPRLGRVLKALLSPQTYLSTPPPAITVLSSGWAFYHPKSSVSPPAQQRIHKLRPHRSAWRKTSQRVAWGPGGGKPKGLAALRKRCAVTR